MRSRGFLGFLGLLLILAIPALVNAASNKAPATFVVTSLADHATNPCDAECTLRDAVVAANLNSGADVVSFDPGLTGDEITLNQGEIAISDGVVIEGPGVDLLKVHAAPNSRIFNIGSVGSSDRSVTISGLTLTGGNVGQPGGAILSQTLNCGADLTLAEVAIVGNSATGDGAAVAVYPNWGACPSKKVVSTSPTTGPLPTSSTVTVPPANQGALTIRNSTISGNHGTGAAGAIYFWSTRPDDGLEISNSTITGNTASGSGGGVLICCGAAPAKVTAAPFPVTIANSTITENDSDNQGGGIFADTVVPTLSSSIVSDNTETRPDVRAKATTDSDLDGQFNAGYSLIGTTAGATVTPIGGQQNIIGEDPQLGGLADNGGSTETLLPGNSSPAVDAGTDNSLLTDQRGFSRTVDRSAANVDDGTDIGAVEVGADSTPTETTTTTTTQPTETTPTTPTTTTTTLPGPSTEECLGKQVILTKGSAADEKLTGTGGDDGILGAGGVDEIGGLEGNDCLFGQAGNDKVDGGPGDDSVQGNRDDDNVNGSDGDDDVRGQNGNDKVSGGADDDKVTGGAGDDNASGGSGDDTLKTNGGNDVINPGAGADTVIAGGGADEIDTADGDKDVVDCGTGKDTAHVDGIDKVDANCNTVDVTG